MLIRYLFGLTSLLVGFGKRMPLLSGMFTYLYFPLARGRMCFTPLFPFLFKQTAT